MIDNLVYSVNAILPIFLLVVLGWFLRRKGRLTDGFTEIADWLVFRVGLPVMLFLEVAESSLSENMDGRLILFLVIAVTVSFTLMSVISLFVVRDPKLRGAFIQGSCRSNFAILGVPLAQNMFGEVGGQVIAITMPFVILMFNSYSVIILSIFSGSREHRFGRDTHAAACLIEL